MNIKFYIYIGEDGFLTKIIDLPYVPTEKMYIYPHPEFDNLDLQVLQTNCKLYKIDEFVAEVYVEGFAINEPCNVERFSGPIKKLMIKEKNEFIDKLMALGWLKED